jgi:hypothetical protein
MHGVRFNAVPYHSCSKHFQPKLVWRRDDANNVRGKALEASCELFPANFNQKWHLLTNFGKLRVYLLEWKSVRRFLSCLRVDGRVGRG